jgi:predicted helicase
MRQSLMNTFQQIFVFDLHGNSKKKETAPDGSKDENVFDIEQGVAVSIFVKRADLEPGVWRFDVWGKRLEKYKMAAEADIRAIPWQKANPSSPFYFFVSQNAEIRSEFEAERSLPTIFRQGGSGMMTSRDNLTIKFTPDDIWKTVKRFSELNEAEARAEFKLGKDARDWNVSKAQNDLKSSGPTRTAISEVTYRPFDTRFTYYTGRARGVHWLASRTHLEKYAPT